MKKGWRKKVFSSVILLSVLSSCTLWDKLTGQEELCDTCVDMTASVSILDTKPAKSGWKARGAFHSKYRDINSTDDILYVEHCNKQGNQLWMNYHFKLKEWIIVEPHNTPCGTLPP